MKQPSASILETLRVYTRALQIENARQAFRQIII